MRNYKRKYTFIIENALTKERFNSIWFGLDESEINEYREWVKKHLKENQQIIGEKAE